LKLEIAITLRLPKAAKKTVNVTLCYYEGTIHRELFDVCDERVKMDDAFCDDIKIQ
jgi:hypothetical protein